MEEIILKIKKDVEGLLVVTVDEVAWEVSDKFKNQILQDLKNHLGGDFSDEFDPMIQKSIKIIKSCIKSSDLEDNEPPRPLIRRIK